MENKNIIWIVLIVVIMIMSGNVGLEKKEVLKSSKPTKQECEDRRQGELDDNDPCVTECFQLTTSVVACFNDYGYTSKNDDVNEWTFLHSFRDDRTCQEEIDQTFIDFPEIASALVNCVDSLKQYDTCVETEWLPLQEDKCFGEVFTQTSNCGKTRQADGTKTCETFNPADTNQDGSINNSELLAYASKWLNNEVTNAELLEAATIWIGN